MFDSERAPSLSFAFKRKILAESRKNLVAVFSSQRPTESFGGRGYSGGDQFSFAPSSPHFPLSPLAPAPSPGHQ